MSPAKSIFCGIFWGCSVLAALIWGGAVDAMRHNKASSELQTAQKRIAVLEEQLAAAAKSIRPDCEPLQAVKGELEVLKARVRSTIDTPRRPGELRAAVDGLRALVYPPGSPKLVRDEFGCFQ